jgi:hypothetical protein
MTVKTAVLPQALEAVAVLERPQGQTAQDTAVMDYKTISLEQMFTTLAAVVVVRKTQVSHHLVVVPEVKAAVVLEAPRIALHTLKTASLTRAAAVVVVAATVIGVVV